MKSKLYFGNRRFIQSNSNNDIKTSDQKYLRYNLKAKYTNDLAKVYEINTFGKFTVIVRRSFVRLNVHSTTHINPCHLYDLSSSCNSEMYLKSDLDHNYNLNQNRKRNKWESLNRKIRKFAMTNKKSLTTNESSTFIVHACMFNQ